MKPFKSSTCPHSRFSKHHHNNFKNNRFVRFLFPLTGLVCLVWWPVRVIPKPIRAEYLCMKVAAPDLNFREENARAIGLSLFIART
jgi:hypothetical protein